MWKRGGGECGREVVDVLVILVKNKNIYEQDCKKKKYL